MSAEISRNAMLRQIDELQSVFRRNLRHLAALGSTAAQLAKPEEFDGFLEQVLDHLLEAADANAAQVSALDPEGEALTVRLCRGFSERWVREEATRPVSECLCGQALATRRPVVVNNLERDPRATRMACRLDGFRACVGVPLVCGDRVLQQVAECLRHTVRQSDVVARYGGDEFVMLLPETCKAEATLAAERIGQALQRLSLPSAPAGGRISGVTASFGVAAYPEDGLEAELLVARADAALYRAKAEGGARVVGWSYPKES